MKEIIPLVGCLFQNIHRNNWLVVSNIFMFYNVWDNPSHWLIFSRLLKPPTRRTMQNWWLIFEKLWIQSLRICLPFLGKVGMVHSWWKPLFNAWTDGLYYVRLVDAILVKNRWLLESHLVVGLEHVFIGNNNPNWRTHIFQKGWNHPPAITWFRYRTCRHFTCFKQRTAFPVQLNTRDQPANMSLNRS